MIENRIREALDAEASRVVPHGHARAENARRLGRARRRRRFGISLVSVVAVATAASAGALLVQLPDGSPGLGRGRDNHDAARDAETGSALARKGALPRDLDPRYRPTGPVVDAGDGSSTWLAGQQVCWRLSKGGGDCLPWRLTPGRHAAVAGLRPHVTQGVKVTRIQTAAFGVADDRVKGVRLELASKTFEGRAGTFEGGRVLTETGSRRRVWQIPVFRQQDQNIVFIGDGGREIQRISLPASKTKTGVPPARPLTTGTPVFTFPTRDGRTATLRLHQDGTMVGFSSTGFGRGDTTGPVGRGGPNYAPGMIDTRPGPLWWYGLLPPETTRVVAEFRDGRKLPATIVRVGRYRVFFVRLDGVRPGLPNRQNYTGNVVQYGAQGERLGSWTF
jgi:hypothetical protein